MCVLIDQNDVAAIEGLQRGQCAFPNLDYSQYPHLNLPRTTLHGAYTNIANNVVDRRFLDELDWNPHGNIDWQNEKLESLSNQILVLINNLDGNLEDETLLTKVFIWIQLWGGNSGRGIFVRGNRWPENFDITKYRDGLSYLLNGEVVRALRTLNQIDYLGTAFSTKHIHFWSNGELPIYDSVIARIVFGYQSPTASKYLNYLGALNGIIEELEEPEISYRSIERNLFNWAETNNGQEWKRIRARNNGQ